MFAGNKKHVKNLVYCCAMDSLKNTINVNWEHRSCERALKEFHELSLLVADVVLSNMEEVNELPYISGCPSKQNIKEGVDKVLCYYKQRLSSGSYATKKTEVFKKSFERMVFDICKDWKQKEKTFFKGKT